MPRINGLAVPEFFYLVIQQPALLAGMSLPTAATPWRALFEIGFRQVVCLIKDPPAYVPDPICLAGQFPLQDLYAGKLPDDPEVEKQLVYQAARLVSDLIERNIGVLVHCVGGTGRTGTVIGCALKALGYNSNQILLYLDQLNRVRGSCNDWPESDWQAKMIRHYLEGRVAHLGV